MNYKFNLLLRALKGGVARVAPVIDGELASRGREGGGSHSVNEMPITKATDQGRLWEGSGTFIVYPLPVLPLLFNLNTFTFLFEFFALGWVGDVSRASPFPLH